MERTPRILCSLLTCACLAAAVGAAHAGDWPQFRGPHRDGISTFVGIDPGAFVDGPDVLWRAESGEGFSGLSIADGRLYTILGRDGGEYVIALDTGTGRELWSYRNDAMYENRFGNGPRSTPTVAGSTVYVVGARNRVSALDAGSGSPRWTLDLAKEFGGRVPTWGISGSPLVDGDRLLLEVGGREGYSVVALDKKTGSVLWHAGNDIPGYASPVVAPIGGARQVVFMTGTKIMGLDPEKGTVLWERGWRTSYDVNAAIPIFVAPNKIFVSTGYDTGAALFTLSTSGGKVSVEETWRSRGMKNQFQASIIHDGIIYGFDNATFKALDLATGKDRWQVRGWGHGSLVYADGYLIVLGDQGKLGLVRATDEGYEEVAATQMLMGKSWTAPSIADGVLYLRNEDSIVALDIARERKPVANSR